MTVNVGQRVAWSVPTDFASSLSERVQLIDNPSVHLLSDNSPLLSTTGWDGGLMEPGGEFSRVFDTPGEYTYRDGLGNSGKVIAVASMLVFLPIVIR